MGQRAHAASLDSPLSLTRRARCTRKGAVAVRRAGQQLIVASHRQRLLVLVLLVVLVRVLLVVMAALLLVVMAALLLVGVQNSMQHRYWKPFFVNATKWCWSLDV